MARTSPPSEQKMSARLRQARLQAWSANEQPPSNEEHKGYASDPSYEEPSASSDEEYEGGTGALMLLLLLGMLTGVGIFFVITWCCCGEDSDHNSSSGDILAIAGMTEVGITTASKEFVKALSGAVLYFFSAEFNMPAGQKLTAEAVQGAASSKAGGSFSLFDETATKRSEEVSDKTLIFSNTAGNPKDVRVLKQLMRLIEKVAPHGLDKFGLFAGKNLRIPGRLSAHEGEGEGQCQRGHQDALNQKSRRAQVALWNYDRREAGCD